jgi:glucose/arabinose dehydrogenase
MKSRLTNKGRVTVTVLTSFLILSTFVVLNSSSYNVDAQPQKLQFPKSQQADLMVINSGKVPPTENFNVAEGFTIQPVLWNLTLPSAVTFDDTGRNMFLSEAGYAYGELHPQPRIIKVDTQNGNVSVFVDRLLNGPITDVVFHNGTLYVSHRGIISTVNPNTGLIKNIITDLPSIGDHHNNQIAFGPDGRLYFGQGTATNSGVVGQDNFYGFPWLALAPTFHDVPGKNVTLTGQNFVTANPLKSPQPPNGNATTGAFVPFGNATEEGQVIKGGVKCSGCIISAKPDGSDLRLVAWGLRNPYGLAFDNQGNLIISNNGADERGSRPIKDDSDKAFLIDVSNSSNIGKFYGWPDFFGGKELKPVTDPTFKSPRGKQPLQFLMQDHPPVEKPLADIGHAVGSTQAAVSNSSIFGLQGMAFIGQFGTTYPSSHTHFEKSMIGERVIMLNPQTGNVTEFISTKAPDPSFRPIGLAFNKNDNALYIASIGKFEVRNTLPNGTPLPMYVPWGYAHTGSVWKVTSNATNTNATATTTGNTTETAATTENAALQNQSVTNPTPTTTTTPTPTLTTSPPTATTPDQGEEDNEGQAEGGEEDNEGG